MTYPLLCVSSKLQAKLKSHKEIELEHNKDEKKTENNNIDYNLYRVFLSIFKKEGILGLYAGFL